MPTKQPDTDFVISLKRKIPTLFWDHWEKMNEIGSLTGFCGACDRLVLTIRYNSGNKPGSSLQLAHDVWKMFRGNSMHAIIECGVKHNTGSNIQDEITKHLAQETNSLNIQKPESLSILWDFGYSSWGPNWTQAATNFKSADVAQIRHRVASNAWVNSILLPSDAHTEIETRAKFTKLPEMWPYPSLEYINYQRKI